MTQLEISNRIGKLIIEKNSHLDRVKTINREIDILARKLVVQQIYQPKTDKIERVGSKKESMVQDYITKSMPIGAHMTLENIAERIKSFGFKTKDKTFKYAIGTLMKKRDDIRKASRGIYYRMSTDSVEVKGLKL